MRVCAAVPVPDITECLIGYKLRHYVDGSERSNSRCLKKNSKGVQNFSTEGACFGGTESNSGEILRTRVAGLASVDGGFEVAG